MDLKKFKTEYPDIATALTEEGRVAGVAEGADKFDRSPAGVGVVK